jgi:hypothetical protein
MHKCTQPKQAPSLLKLRVNSLLGDAQVYPAKTGTKLTKAERANSLLGDAQVYPAKNLPKSKVTVTDCIFKIQEQA